MDLPEEIFQFTLPPISSTKLPGVVNKKKSPRKKIKSNSSVSDNQLNEAENEKSDNELEKYIIKALRGESMKKCDINLFPEIIESLESQYESYVKSDMHEEAQNTYKALRHARRSQEEVNVQIYQQKVLQDLENRRQKAVDELQELNDKTKNIELNMILAFQEQNSNLEEKHQKEIEKFDEEWTSTNKQRMYNKSSAELKQLRRQEDMYLDQKMYGESISAKKIADKIEKNEIKNAMQQMEFDYQTALRPIKLQHQQECKTLAKAQEDEERNFKNAVKSETDLILARIKKLDGEIEKFNDLPYVERVRLRSTSSKDLKTDDLSLSKSFKKQVSMNEFNQIPAVKPKSPSSRRALIKSPVSPRSHQKH